MASVVPLNVDVFISYRDKDSRNTFVAPLNLALGQQGIRVFEHFKDDEMQPISEDVVKAIKESRVAVIVFSKNYANSSLCLEELSTIMECHDQMGGQKKVLPVFYHVDPSDVRNQKRDFATAFETHEDKFKGEMDNVNKWRDAVTAAANLSSHHIFSGYEGKAAFISNIAEEISAHIQSSAVPTRKQGWTYDVFLSFRGEDTGNNFSDHLYDALDKVRRVFRHRYAGQTISEEVVKAIKESRVAVVVFSKNYANSSLCLEELSTIMECHDQMGQRVLPVFYHVDPSDICVQEGELDKVKKWKIALTAATADLSGFHILPDNMGESTFVKEIVRKTLADVDVNERKIGKLFVSDKEIGIGSNGTVVLVGSHDTRPVAVKRIVKGHNDVASKEIKILIDSDQHPNIVRYYDVEDDPEFVYIALERCICSLHDLILPPTNPTVDHSQLTLLEVESFKVRGPIGYPSPELLKVLRDTVAGLAHLHELGIIHRDLKPQNVLICKYSSITAKVSDMGISKRLPVDMSCLTKSATGKGSSGWQAPETLRKEPQSRAVDLFGFGCLLFFCITGGRHPFGNMLELDINIGKNDPKNLSLVNIPEAFDLVSNLIQHDPKSRPSAAEVYHHPLFWNTDTRLSFLEDAYKRLESEKSGSVLLTELVRIGPDAFGSRPWNEKLDDNFVKHTELDCNKYNRKQYKYDSVLELLRLIRNKKQHHDELPKNIRDVLGDVPTGYEGYFRKQFPNLLIEVYKLLKPCCGEERLKKYYEKTLDY